jgi:hypothetical protein
MTYSIARVIDPYRGTFQVQEVTDDFENAWRRAGSAWRLFPEQIFFVMGTETREDPMPAQQKAW